MNNPRCSSCGAGMAKNGKTSAGAQRWRCLSCGSSSVRKIDSAASRAALMMRMPAPAMLVSDGSLGLAKAAKDADGATAWLLEYGAGIVWSEFHRPTEYRR